MQPILIRGGMILKLVGSAKLSDRLMNPMAGAFMRPSWEI